MTDKGEEECQKILSKNDYYEILGLQKTATEDEIRKAYKKLAIKFHPDKNKSKSAEEAFKKVNQAFSVLGDKDKKKNYDLFGNEEGMGMSSGGGPDINPFEMFNMFFQGTPFGNMGMGGSGTGRTQIRFNNGNVSYTVFSSGGGFPGFSSFGGFANDDDDSGDIFSQMFFGGAAPRTRRKEGDGGGRNFQQGQRQHRQNDVQKEMQKNMERTMMCLQLFPLICCILFIVIPVLHGI